MRISTFPALPPRIPAVILVPRLLFDPTTVVPDTVFSTSASVLPELRSSCSRPITVNTLPVSDCFFGYLLAVKTTSSREDTFIVSYCAYTHDVMNKKVRSVKILVIVFLFVPTGLKRGMVI